MQDSIATLIVDDEDDVRLLMRLAIDAANHGLFVCAEAGSGHEALTVAAERPPDVVVLDQRMPGMSGIETARALRADHPEIRIVLCSAFLDDEVREEARRMGVDRVVAKRDISQLPSAIFAIVSTN